MMNLQLQNILYRYANTKGVGSPLTAEEMLNAISSWLVDTLPDCIDVDIEMLPVGSKPTVKLTGQGTPDNHYKFSFGIPEGVQVTDVTIEENGDLVFTYNNGEQDNAGAVVANIEIGQVDTLPAGSQATASFSGTTKNKVLNLGIPQGIQGETGALVYKALGQTSRVPTTGNISLNVSGFNRTPIAGETFVRYVQGISGIAGRMWFEFCTALGTFTAGTLADVTVDNVIEITGPQGPAGANGDSGTKLYQHVLTDSSSRPAITIITKSPNKISKIKDIISQMPILGVYGGLGRRSGTYYVISSTITFYIIKAFNDASEGLTYTAYSYTTGDTFSDEVTQL